MKRNLRIIVAHPGKQHSYKLASALKRNGMLLFYATTIYDKHSSLIMRLVKLLLSGDNRKRAKTRRNNDLDDNDVVLICEVFGFIEALLVRIDKNHNIYRRFQAWNAKRFGLQLAKLAIKKQADTIICYDSNASSCFDYLKKHAPHIKRIMDVSILI